MVTALCMSIMINVTQRHLWPYLGSGGIVQVPLMLLFCSSGGGCVCAYRECLLFSFRCYFNVYSIILRSSHSILYSAVVHHVPWQHVSLLHLIQHCIMFFIEQGFVEQELMLCANLTLLMMMLWWWVSFYYLKLVDEEFLWWALWVQDNGRYSRLKQPQVNHSVDKKMVSRSFIFSVFFYSYSSRHDTSFLSSVPLVLYPAIPLPILPPGMSLMWHKNHKKEMFSKLLLGQVRNNNGILALPVSTVSGVLDLLLTTFLS